jgi:GAF domain-containing protein
MEKDPVLQQIRTYINESQLTHQEKQQKIVAYLQEKKPTFNWVGFYHVNETAKTLELGCYVGDHTDHTVIPIGKGICGQVAANPHTFVVPDVQKADNYLSCSINVKSEIVVPIFKNGKMVAELDIDSHTLNAFSDEEQKLLETICQEIAVLF